MKKYLALIFLFITFSYAQDTQNAVDCLILEDENSIICKYTHERVDFDKEVEFQWIEPDGRVTRTRSLVIPAYHGSVYDYRYIEGRTKGEWTFKVIDDSTEYKTTFILE
jgi:hypothetical protein